MVRRLSLLIAAAVVLAMSATAAVTDTLTIVSRHLDSPEKVTVTVPDAAADPAARLSTVYLLNGYSGDHTSWTKLRPDMRELADRYGIVIVMPDGRDSWYWDSRPGLEMESFITEDLVPYIDSHYPVVADRSRRAISGLSMGGHGAMWLAARHSDIWGSAASMSGGLDIRPFPRRWGMARLIGTDKDVWEAHTVINLVPLIKEGNLNILFDCGTDDFFIDVNRNMHRALLDAGVPHDYTERPGGHSGKYWANSILYHLLFFNEAFNR